MTSQATYLRFSSSGGTQMQIIDHERQPLEEWRAGVVTRMQVSALTGAAQLCLFEQWCEPGKGAPTHLHPVEEVLTVLQGEAEVWIEGERSPLLAGQSVIVPAGRKHGFPQYRRSDAPHSGDGGRAGLRDLLR